MHDIVCWTVSEGGMGMISQLEGLSEALGYPTIHKVAKKRFPWGLMPRTFTWNIFNQLSDKSDSFLPPWPDILLTCGRDAIPISLAIKKLSNNRTFTVHTQHPRIDFGHFDMIIAPEHDNIKGPNVISSKWALHKITTAKLEKSRTEFQDMFAKYQPPYQIVLIGGNTNKYQMPINAMTHLINNIEDIKSKTQGSILVTPSYRTDRDQLSQLVDHFKDNNQVYVHDLNNKHNPYITMLAIAENIFVTDDSVNMISEACYTEKPVYILKMLGQSDLTKPKIFTNQLVAEGIVRYYQSKIEQWKYSVIKEINALSKQVQDTFMEHQTKHHPSIDRNPK